ncbi:MAG: hypothetical protein FP831_00030 [Anaerolineae bacterium]|nr:hypothetical protein [Anaerolineae bacterium]
MKPIAVWGMCFWDWCIWGSDEDFDLLRKIHLVLFPETPYEWGEYAKQKNLDINILDQTWKNHRFDSMTIWSHIKYTNDFFITNDNNFHKQTKKGVLINFGARKILTTSEAFHYLKKSS